MGFTTSQKPYLASFDIEFGPSGPLKAHIIREYLICYILWIDIGPVMRLIVWATEYSVKLWIHSITGESGSFTNASGFIQTKCVMIGQWNGLAIRETQPDTNIVWKPHLHHAVKGIYPYIFLVHSSIRLLVSPSSLQVKLSDLQPVIFDILYCSHWPSLLHMLCTLRKKCYNDVDPPHPVSF